MNVNVGKIDRIIRLVVGVVLVLAPFVSGMALFEGSTAKVIAVVVGLVLIATSAMKFCPLYRIFGIRTCQR